MQDESFVVNPPLVPLAKWAPARDRVYQHVRDGIMQGQFAGGTFLEEEQVSLAVGVSRTPVREAFQQLHGERLIDLMPRRGAMVRIVTVQELQDVYEARLMMEAHAARRICADRRGVPAVMQTTLAAMQGSADAATAQLVRMNTDFHRALVGGAGNGVTTELWEALSARQERVAMTSVALDPGRRSVILGEHEALVAALAVHDAVGAVAVLARHLRPIRQIVSRLPGFADEAG